MVFRNGKHKQNGQCTAAGRWSVEIADCKGNSEDTFIILQYEFENNLY
jgi:hypothetical protein